MVACKLAIPGFGGAPITPIEEVQHTYCGTVSLHVAPDSLIPDAARRLLHTSRSMISSRPIAPGTDDTIGPLQKRAASFFLGVCPSSVGLPQSPAERGSNGAI